MKNETQDETTPEVCSVCHQPLKKEYYFCPNCGTKVITLSTDSMSQLKLYLFSIFLPFIAYIMIGKWHGLRYARSNDGKARVVGYIACALLILSTIGGVWYTVVAVQNAVTAATQDINEVMGY